jgi:hypothetical protein
MGYRDTSEGYLDTVQVLTGVTGIQGYLYTVQVLTRGCLDTVE